MSKLTQEETQFIKLVLIVVGEGSNVLRDIIRRCIKENEDETCEVFFNKYLTKKAIKEISTNSTQVDILNDKSKRAECDYDITLLMKFIAIFYEYEYESWEGWKREDKMCIYKSCQYIDNIRNCLSHKTFPSVPKDEFEKCVDEMRVCIKQLGGDTKVIDDKLKMEFDVCLTPILKAFLDLIQGIKESTKEKQQTRLFEGDLKLMDKATANFNPSAEVVKIKAVCSGESNLIVNPDDSNRPEEQKQKIHQPEVVASTVHNSCTLLNNDQTAAETTYSAQKQQLRTSVEVSEYANSSGSDSDESGGSKFFTGGIEANAGPINTRQIVVDELTTEASEPSMTDIFKQLQTMNKNMIDMSGDVKREIDSLTERVGKIEEENKTTLNYIQSIDKQTN